MRMMLMVMVVVMMVFVIIVGMVMVVMIRFRIEVRISFGIITSVALWNGRPRLNVSVKKCEVVGDDRNSEGDKQDSADTAGCSHDVPNRRARVHVAVAHCGHCDDGPPEAHGNRGKHVSSFRGVLPLRIVDHRGEDEHPYQQEDEEHQEFLD